MKKIISIVLCLVMLTAVLASCSTLKEDEKGAVISVYLSEFPDTLDPALIQLNDETSQLLSLIYESLTTIDANGNVVGSLATKWYGKYDERDEEYKMYFELKDTSWDDTTGVQAQHVVDAWARILSPEIDSPYASLLYPIKNAKNVKSGVMTRDDLGVAAEDDHLLCVTFEDEFDINLFAEIVSDIHLCPQREDVIQRAEKEGEDWAADAGTIVCSGPFKVQAFDDGKKLVLERNPYYMRDVEEDALDKSVLPYRITCLYQEAALADISKVNDADKKTQSQYQISRWESDNIFYYGSFDKSSYEYFGSKLTTKSVLSSCALYFNCDVITDADVRNAMSMAIDRSKLVTEITGTGEVAATGIVPNGVFATGKGTSFRDKAGDIYKTTADLDAAKALMKGKKTGSITLTYLIPESGSVISGNRKKAIYENVYEAIANECAAAFKELGFNVKTNGLNPDDFRTAMTERNFDVMLTNVIGDSTEAFNYLAPFAKYYSGAAVSIDFTSDSYSLHYTNYNSDEYEAIIDEAVMCSDRAKRFELMKQAEQKLAEDCPMATLFGYTHSYVTKGDLSGLSTNYFGFVNFTKASLKDWRNINAAEEEASNEAAMSQEAAK